MIVSLRSPLGSGTYQHPMRVGAEVFFHDGHRLLPAIVVEMTERYCVVGIFGLAYVTDTISSDAFRESAPEKYGQWRFR